MSLYDAAKDAVKIAQKLDNVELVQKLLDVQEQALEMQQKQFDQNKVIETLNEKIKKLEERKKYRYAEGHNYMVDPDNPSQKLCPTCLNRDGFENPMADYDSGGYCKTCGKVAD